MRPVISLADMIGALVLQVMVPPALAQPSAETLGAVGAHGLLLCGVTASEPGFSIPDSQGMRRGLEVDDCREHCQVAGARGSLRRTTGMEWLLRCDVDANSLSPDLNGLGAGASALAG